MERDENLEWNIARTLKGTPTPLDDGAALIAYAVLRLAEAQFETAQALRDLGNGDATTTMGALEALGKHMGEKVDELTQAVREIGG